MNKAFFAALCLLASAAAFAADEGPVRPVRPDTAQAAFDNLAERRSFGSDEIAMLREIMKTGADIDAALCPDKLTWYCATNDLFDEFLYLIGHRADYGIKNNDDGMTLLHETAKGGHLEIVKHLVEQGAEINLPDKKGLRALHYAIMSGNLDLISYLLEQGANPNAETTTRETPLHFAVKYAGNDVVKLLLDKGASIKSINKILLLTYQDKIRQAQNAGKKNSSAALFDSIMNEANGIREAEHEETAEEDDLSYLEKQKVIDPRVNHIDPDHLPFDLLPKEDFDAMNEDGETALHYAARKGDLDILKTLIEHGADITAQDEFLSRTALHHAAVNGNLDCVKYLVEQGADIMDKDSIGATAFHYAAKSNNLEVAKFLVSKKLDYTAKDARDWTAMHYAAYGGSIGVVKYLLAKDLDINAKNERGKTPLFFARNKDLRDYMISKGAR